MSDRTPTSEQALESPSYEQCMDILVTLVQTMKMLPLDKMIATVDRAQSLGPILYPSKYRGADLGSQERLLRAAQALVQVARRIEAGHA